MPAVDEALFWLPTAAVVVVALVAVIAAVVRPGRLARAIWVGAAVVVGAAAVAATVWYQTQSRAERPAQAAQLRQLGSHIDEIGQQLPPEPGSASAENFDTFPAAMDTLNAKLAELGKRIQALREKTRNREIDPQTAAALTDFLRQAGSNRVVVSCIPNDVEAYAYANQIANLLRAAGWEAHGPEETTIFGNGQGMGITLFVHAGGQPPPAAKILLDGFTRFNIPYRAGITPTDAIPDPATVELFVGRKE